MSIEGGASNNETKVMCGHFQVTILVGEYGCSKLPAIYHARIPRPI